MLTRNALSKQNITFKLSIIAWIILFSLRVALEHSTQFFDNIIQIYEIILHCITLIYVSKIYKTASVEDSKNIIWLLYCLIFFLLNDASFYFALFLQSTAFQLMTTRYDIINLLLNNVPFSIWLVCILLFLSKILFNYVITIQEFIKLLLILLIFDIVIIIYYWMPVNFSHNTFSLFHNGFLILSSIVELMIFELCIISLIYSKKSSFSLISSGFIIVIAGDFLTTYGRMTQVENLFKYGDSIWCLGIIFILQGLILIDKDKTFAIKNLFNSKKHIKSPITVWTLCISLLSFMLFFITHIWRLINLWLAVHKLCEP